MGVATHKGRLFAFVNRCAAKDTTETFERRPDGDSPIAKPELSNRIFVITASLLHDRQRTPNAAVKFKIAEHNDAIGEIADVQRRIHRPYQAMLCQDELGMSVSRLAVLHRRSGAQRTGNSPP